jgi:hypothetical protein
MRRDYSTNEFDENRLFFSYPISLRQAPLRARNSGGLFLINRCAAWGSTFVALTTLVSVNDNREKCHTTTDDNNNNV